MSSQKQHIQSQDNDQDKFVEKKGKSAHFSDEQYQNCYLLMGRSGSGKTTFYNAVMKNKQKQQQTGACCQTKGFQISESDDKRMTLLDCPDFTCSNKCFQKALNKNKIIDKIKFKGVIVFARFENRISQILSKFRQVFMLDDLIKPEVQDKAILIITYMDKSKDQGKYETQSRKAFDNQGFKNKKIFCSLKNYSEETTNKIKASIIKHFADQMPRSLNLHEYQPEQKKVIQKVEVMRQEIKKSKNKEEQYKSAYEKGYDEGYQLGRRQLSRSNSSYGIGCYNRYKADKPKYSSEFSQQIKLFKKCLNQINQELLARQEKKKEQDMYYYKRSGILLKRASDFSKQRLKAEQIFQLSKDFMIKYRYYKRSKITDCSQESYINKLYYDVNDKSSYYQQIQEPSRCQII